MLRGQGFERVLSYHYPGVETRIRVLRVCGEFAANSQPVPSFVMLRTLFKRRRYAVPFHLLHSTAATGGV